MATAEETLELCRGSETCDQLMSPERPTGVIVHGCVYLPGCGEKDPEFGERGYADDLLIVPGAGWTLFWRDPESCEEPMWSREWQGGTYHETWDELVNEAYSL